MQMYQIELYRYRRAVFWWNENRRYCNLFSLNSHVVELLHDHLLILSAHFLQKFQGVFLSYRSSDLALSLSCRVTYNSSYSWGIMTLQNKDSHKRESALHKKNVLHATVIPCLVCKLKVFQETESKKDLNSHVENNSWL